jgi:molybdopterin-containing oxidoreductase family iron-sulfur binding subunit
MTRLVVLDDEQAPVGEPGPDGEPGISRRRFLSQLGVSMTLAGIGCRGKPAEKILPYSRQPPEVTPGVPVVYATSMTLSGLATGLLVATREGRPIKIEGNPDHPASLGASGVFEQAAVLELYDPNRADTLREGDTPRSLRSFAEAFGANGGRRGDHGAGLFFLLEPTSSPLVEHLIGRLRARYPEARVHFHDPLADLNRLAGLRTAFGRALVPQYHLDQAEVVLSLDSDFLAEGPFHLRWARQFAAARRRGTGERMTRFYAVESSPSSTGTAADHRIAIQCRQVVAIAAAIAAEVLGARPIPGLPGPFAELIGRWRNGPHGELASQVAKDLLRRPGVATVIVGGRQPAAVHALGALINAALGAPLHYTSPAVFEAGEPSHDLASLVQALSAGQVDRLVIIGGNPMYTAPADVELGRAIARARTSAYLGLFENETAQRCRWFVPLAHFLESWGDARAYDGTLSLVQPLIEPLHGGRTVAEILALFATEAEASPRALLEGFWRGQAPGAAPEFPRSLADQLGFRGTGQSRVAPPETPLDWRTEERFDQTFSRALERGLLAGTAFPAQEVAHDWPALSRLLGDAALLPADTRTRPYEIAFYPDPSVRDGSFTDNPWLLELPQPITKLSWGNAVLINPSTAKELAIEHGAQVALRYRGRTLEGPAFVLPGQAVGSFALSFGFGREGLERNALGVGVNAYRLRTTAAPYFDRGLEVVRSGPPSTGPDRIVTTQSTWSQEGRELAEAATLTDLAKDPLRWVKKNEPRPSIRAAWPEESPQWGMAIDLGLCFGCNACVVACQAENNVPVVGKVDVEKKREMYWLRVDQYMSGDPDNPSVISQPMLCQHCEHAPCEYVCPVNATVHSPDGLNEMVYNRCVGTRFCSNNCPYKVRRFNWFNWHDNKTEIEKMPMNPDVTVRERGVMEKCTYCVQRIRSAEIRARIAGRPIAEGEVRTACQAACPAEAIVFGNIADPDAAVSRLRRDPRAYGVLAELGTSPRTLYLARITNPNPAFVAGSGGERPLR